MDGHFGGLGVGIGQCISHLPNSSGVLGRFHSCIVLHDGRHIGNTSRCDLGWVLNWTDWQTDYSLRTERIFAKTSDTSISNAPSEARRFAVIQCAR